jgi:hypothetical protein
MSSIHLMHFEPLFAQADHHARLGEDLGIMPFDALQQSK